MEEESFNNIEIATRINTQFVAIKLDREERPDLDTIYQTVASRSGLIGFEQLVSVIVSLWTERRTDIEATGGEVIRILKQSAQSVAASAVDHIVLSQRTVARSERQFDPKLGGFENAPKFPLFNLLRFLVHESFRTPKGRAGHMADITLQKMAHSGMYDQIGGGFHRYTTVAEWNIPHFGRMHAPGFLLSRRMDLFRFGRN